MKPNYKKSKIKKESKKYEESQFMSIYQTLDPSYKVKIMSLKANQNNVIESKSKNDKAQFSTNMMNLKIKSIKINQKIITKLTC
jgi:hypothetical protein